MGDVFSAGTVSFERPEPDDHLLAEVFALGESESRYLGMLTPQAWREYASKRTVLAAVSGDGELLGYAAFRLPRNRVVLAHLVVHPRGRRRGVAKRIIDHLSAEYASKTGIAARCRRDYPANDMWPSLGFVALGDRPGRSVVGHRLTDWWRDHGHPDLLTWEGAPSAIVSVVADANVFLDLHGRDAGSQAEVTRMIFNSISDRIELLVTPELHNEVDRVIDETDRRRLQSIIDTYPRLRVAPDVLARTRAALIESLGHAPAGARDVSDLNHIAYAAAAGVSVVATRDLAVLQRLTAPAEQVGLRIVSPDDLVALVDERESAPAYTPAALLDTGYQVAEAGVSDNVVLERFVDGGAGERKKDFRLRVGELARQRPSSSRLLFTDPDGEPVALLGYAPSEQTLEVTVARLRPSSLRSTIAAQVVSGVRTAALARQKNLIHVTDPFADSAMYQAFLADGYRPTSSGVMAATVGGVLSVNELRSQLRSLRRSLSPDDGASVLPSWLDVDIQPDLVEPNTAASIERQLRPLKLYDAPIPAWMVPIKPHYASQLFGYPAELFPRGDELGISVEQVYYRAGRSGEEAPGRIFWYVSGSRNGEVIGTSELVEVADGSPDVLWRGIDDSVSTLGKRLRIVLIRKTQCAR